MENRTTPGQAHVISKVASRHHGAISTAEAEHKRFVDLAYRLVRCTEPAEQDRLKEEVVRLVLGR